jgi:putative pyoverdin transport system ATP-binding/permease protein
MKRKRKNGARQLSIRIISVMVLMIQAMLSLVYGAPDPITPATPVPEMEKIETIVRQLMEEGNIPGLSLVIVRQGKENSVIIKSFGYADLEKKIPVTPDTFFELASCSKAFTGLAVLKLEKEGLIDLDAKVSHYFPWFRVTRRGKDTCFTLRQALYQTSGLSTSTISMLQPGSGKDALEQTVRNLAGIELVHEPGTHYEYATVNYDILGAVIQKVTGMTYEGYMKQHILTPLGMTRTVVGVDKTKPLKKKAAGYKTGFFRPRKYEAPVYRGNNPAGYVITNGKDMSSWLKHQLGADKTELAFLIEKSHQPDMSVTPPANMLTSYAAGWMVNLYGGGGIFHGGLNPNYTAYVRLDKTAGIAVALMANSNSTGTEFIGRTVLRMLKGHQLREEFDFTDGIDKAFSIFSIILGIFLLFILAFIIMIWVEKIKGRREYEAPTGKKIMKALATLLMFTPFLYGIYLVPRVLADFTWATVRVWAPVSFQVSIMLLLLTMAMGYVAYIASILYPQRNPYLRSAPMLILLSLLTGGANAVVIFLITGSLYVRENLIYQLYYFALAMVLYIWGRKVLQGNLIRLTFNIVYDLRMKLMEKVFYTTFERFERIDRGQVFATLNNDTNQIGGTANVLVGLITSIVTALGAFIYLATIAFWATVLTSAVIAAIAILYYVVSRNAQESFNEARDTQDDYMGLINGLLDGFKELNLHVNKKVQYMNEVEETTDDFRKKSSIARIKLLYAFLVGESLLIVVLGAVGFAVPRLFPNIQDATLVSFIMVLLYLIGPINAILTSVPGLIQMKVAWERVQEFLEAVQSNTGTTELKALPEFSEVVETVKVKQLEFHYKNEEDDEDDIDLDEEDDENFRIGPIDFEAKKGEIIFIVGGNGSGKTTLLKVLTGLYESDAGGIEINGKMVPAHRLGEYFSVVFGDFHLFEKIYDVDMTRKAKEAHYYLRLLKMEQKVEFVNGSFSTTELSGGQKKRLSMLLCYLEDRPIFLFDEVAADQDPTFRKFFYRDLLYRMKEQGKIVIAITHDDHYFDVADRVIKLDMGKVESVTSGAHYRLSNVEPVPVETSPELQDETSI